MPGSSGASTFGSQSLDRILPSRKENLPPMQGNHAPVTLTSQQKKIGKEGGREGGGGKGETYWLKHAQDKMAGNSLLGFVDTMGFLWKISLRKHYICLLTAWTQDVLCC